MGYIKRLPIAPKVLAIFLVAGIAVGGVLDTIQGANINRLFDSYLDGQLHQDASENRVRFDLYMDGYGKTISLLAAHGSLISYARAMPARPGAPVYHDGIPAWLPNTSVLRHMSPMRFALLMDREGVLREVYRAMPGDALPRDLETPSPLMRELSHNQSFTTMIDNAPYLLATEWVEDGDGLTLARLMIAAPIDQDFLVRSQGLVSGTALMALMTQDDPRVVSSSNPEEIPAGARLADLMEDYRVMGKSFFDRGGSDLSLQLISFMPRREASTVIASIIRSERQQRAITVGVTVVILAAVLLWVTSMIRKVADEVARFESEALGVKREGDGVGNEIELLTMRFRDLFAEVLESREKIRQQAEDLLREKSIYLDSMLHSSTMSIVATDSDMTVKYFNEVASRLCGCSFEELRGKKLLDTPFTRICHMDDIDACAAKVSRGEEAVSVTLHNAPSGRLLYLETRCTGIVDKEGILAGYLIITSDVTERVDADERMKKYATELEQANAELKDALAKVKVLSGLIPICASCKNVRSDKNYWQSVESYVSEYTEAKFSHGVCPECAKKLYPEYFKDDADFDDEDLDDKG